MTNPKYKTIGILGGMGPAATAELYKKIVFIFQERFNAKYDKDFPEIVIISSPIPDVVENNENEELTISMLINASQRLEKAGCSFISIPCNTVHAYIDKLRNSVKIPVLSIIEEAAKTAKEENLLKIGLLSTEFTKNQKLYDLELSKLGIKLIKLDNYKQALLTNVIMDTLSGSIDQSKKSTILRLIKYLRNKGAEAVILGCTELPLIVNKKVQYGMELIDTIDLLAEACARESTKGI